MFLFTRNATLIGFLAALALSCAAIAGKSEETKPKSADAPAHDFASWGEDHVGKPLPDYVTGDECLFCHRNDIGPKWPVNRHGRTMRFKRTDEPPVNEVAELEKVPALKEFVEQVEMVMGRKEKIRFLKPNAAYGKMDIANVEMIPAAKDRPVKFLHAEKPAWDETTFSEKCAGCHATAVETESRAFAAFALDCYACHGSVTLNHTNDTSLMLLSKKRKDEPRVIASACGQCHLRGGTSKSTGLPYPNQFVAGDNLFKDYVADFSDAHLAKLDPGERHIFRNVRDMASGATATTCVSCHKVHENSSTPHRGIEEEPVCFDCHNHEGPKKKTIPYERHSETCSY